MFTLAKNSVSDLFELFYPSVCLACAKKLLRGEKIICVHCENEMPQTEHHKSSSNNLMKRFAGRIELQSAAALYIFHKGSPVQHLLHQLKYRGRKDAGEYLGNILGNKLISEKSVFGNVDLIVPVPLHWKKLKLRGYNQCDSFAQGLSHTLNVPFSATALERVHENISQTKKSRLDRWGNVSEIFAVKDSSQLKAKHILLVDDVVTTGATAEACLQIILQVADTKVSFAAIAAAAK